MTDPNLDLAAALCMEELLEALGTEGKEAWFTIIRRHMKRITTKPPKRPLTSAKAKQILEAIRQQS